MNTVIECENLRHSYNRTEVLHGINFTIEHGGIVGLLGKNGAGKSTTINILMGFLQPDSGRCSVLGHPSHSIPPAQRQNISLLHEGFVQYDFMTIKEIEQFYASFYPAWDKSLYYDLVDRLDVPKTRQIAKLSCGQRSQITLGLLLAQRAKLMILDDYSLGLDVGYRLLFLEFLRDYVDKYETTVLLTSHIVQELDNFLDKVILLQKGTILANTSKSNFTHSFFRHDLPLPLATRDDCGTETFLTNLEKIPEILRTEMGKNQLSVFTSVPQKEELRPLLAQAGYNKTAPVHAIEMNFEQAFVGMTGRY